MSKTSIPRRLKNREEFAKIEIRKELQKLKKDPEAQEALCKRFGFTGTEDPLLKEEISYQAKLKAYREAPARIEEKAKAQLKALQQMETVFGEIPKGEKQLPPKTRAQCEWIPRPCSRFRCHYNIIPDWFLGIRNSRFSSLTDIVSCALDADDGLTLEKIGNSMSMTRERARQNESLALRKLGKTTKGLPLIPFFEGKMRVAQLESEKLATANAGKKRKTVHG